MKNETKKARFFLLCVMIFLGISSVKSTNLYVYLSSGFRQTISMDESQKLTFTDNSLVISRTSGDPVSVRYSDLDFISLKVISGYTGLDSKAIVPVSVYPGLATDKVTVASGTKIGSVELYDLQGRKLMQAYPESQQMELFVSSYPSGVYLLKIADETGVTVKRIIKK